MTPPAATAAGRTIPRPAAPSRPRRVSGPSRPRRAAGPRPVARSNDPFALRAFARVVTLADSRLLRRLVHGRLWIPLVAAGLMGIVFMQVSMLKLNAGIGRAVQSASTLERQNASLRADVSRMEAGERIDDVAHGLGMVVPADGGEHYVTAGRHGTAARAAARMTAPGPVAIARTQAAAATQAANAAAAAGTTAATGAAATTPAAPPAAAATTPAPQTTPSPTTTQQTAQAPAQPAAATPQTQTQTQTQTQSPTPAPTQAPASTAPATAATAPSGGIAAPTTNGQP
jgi:hypothetical protein